MFERVLNTPLISITNFQYKRSPPEAFLGKSGLKICSKFTGERSCRSAISIKLRINFIEITLWHGCFPKTLLNIFRTPFPKNTSESLLLSILVNISKAAAKDHLRVAVYHLFIALRLLLIGNCTIKK